MLEPVSALGFHVGVAALYALARSESAISSAARQVQVRAETIVDRVESSDALFGGKIAVISELWGLTQSHTERGWDGGEALPANQNSISMATAFIRALPDSLQTPEVGVDPDGSVTLDWMVSRHRMLSISFSGDRGRMSYAWVDGADKGNAVASFDRNSVPNRVMQAIAAITAAPVYAGLRAA